MSNETDLDWLARVLDKWPDGDGIDMLGGGCLFFDTGVGRSVHVYATDGSDYTTIKETDWLARRAELQNKPSFADHSDAKCFFQHANGVWSKNIESHDMGIDAIGWRNKYQSLRADYGWLDVGKGEILGDWRDTLEKRPEEFKPSIEEANRMAQEFKPFTSIEDNQEKDMKQDNRWCERGELPPVGARVNVDGPGLVYGDGERDCEVLTHVEDTAVVRMSYGLGCFQSHVLSPSRTEREVLIEHMQSDIAERWANCEELATHLVDKGWVKVGK